MKPAVNETLAVLSALWVYRDASRRQVARPGRWALGVLLFWLPLLPAYLLARRRGRR